MMSTQANHPHNTFNSLKKQQGQGLKELRLIATFFYMFLFIGLVKKDIINAHMFSYFIFNINC